MVLPARTFRKIGGGAKGGQAAHSERGENGNPSSAGMPPLIGTAVESGFPQT